MAMTDDNRHKRDTLMAEQAELIMKRIVKAGLTPAEAITMLLGIAVSLSGSAINAERDASDT